jgi:hypothetical protein
VSKPVPIVTGTTSQTPPNLLEMDSQEFAEFTALFRYDDFNTVAQACPLDIVNKTNSDFKATNNTIQMDTKTISHVVECLVSILIFRITEM